MPSDVGQRWLTLTSVGHSLKFEMQDLPALSYENTIRVTGEKMVTHPRMFMWRGGKIGDFTIELDLHVGVQQRVPTPGELIAVTEKLFTMALPDNHSKLPSVLVTISGSPRWWYQRVFFKSVSAQPVAPYDEHGRPMRMKVKIDCMPCFVESTARRPTAKSYPSRVRGWSFKG